MQTICQHPKGLQYYCFKCASDVCDDCLGTHLHSLVRIEKKDPQLLSSKLDLIINELPIELQKQKNILDYISNFKGDYMQTEELKVKLKFEEFSNSLNNFYESYNELKKTFMELPPVQQQNVPFYPFQNYSSTETYGSQQETPIDIDQFFFDYLDESLHPKKKVAASLETPNGTPKQLKIPIPQLKNPHEEPKRKDQTNHLIPQRPVLKPKYEMKKKEKLTWVEAFKKLIEYVPFYYFMDLTKTDTSNKKEYHKYQFSLTRKEDLDEFIKYVEQNAVKYVTEKYLGNLKIPELKEIKEKQKFMEVTKKYNIDLTNELEEHGRNQIIQMLNTLSAKTLLDLQNKIYGLQNTSYKDKLTLINKILLFKKD